MQSKDITLIFVFFASLIFCVVMLYTGTRQRRIWNPADWADIDGKTSPWNYRVAVFIWSFVAVLMLIGLVVEAWRLFR